MERAPFDIGEEVHDQHDDDPDTAVVTTTPKIPAEDWDIPHLERTVAEDNPTIPPMPLSRSSCSSSKSMTTSPTGSATSR
jgi:hypothetical protein